MFRFLTAAFIATQALTAGAACYTVYDAKSAIVYRANVSPVDLRYQLGDTVPAKFGNGAVMVFTLADDGCLQPETPNAVLLNGTAGGRFLSAAGNSTTGGGFVPVAVNSGSTSASKAKQPKPQ